MSNKQALVICGFPGVGKTHLFNMNKKLRILDSDSSKFSWVEGKMNIEREPTFPANYIQHIKDNLYSQDIILVSTHSAVVDELTKSGIPFMIACPTVHGMAEYLRRYAERGSSQAFIDNIKSNWSEFLATISSSNANILIMKDNQCLSDVLTNLFGYEFE